MPRLDLRERPALPTSVQDLVVNARGRLLLAGILRLAVTLLGLAAVLSAILVGIARFVVIPWAEPFALALWAASLIVALILALIRRASPVKAALAVDRRLGGFDRVSTALELSSRVDHSIDERRQLADAEAWSKGRSLDGFGTVWPRRPLPQLVAVALAATLVMALVPSSADVAFARRQAEISRGTGPWRGLPPAPRSAPRCAPSSWRR